MLENALRALFPTWAGCKQRVVLILVLLENALRARTKAAVGHVSFVLILVLLENALRESKCKCKCKRTSVLILVLLENALRVLYGTQSETATICLNPCFVGKCSTRNKQCQTLNFSVMSLNPCFVGKCSTRLEIPKGAVVFSISLNPCFVGKCSTSTEVATIVAHSTIVLILVLLENALRATFKRLCLTKF